MIWLTRPHTGRLIAGVCRAIEGAYGVPVLLVRAICVVSFVVAPVTLVFYLLLALSIPSERSVLSALRLRVHEAGPVGFSRLTSLLLDRTGARSAAPQAQQRLVVPLLLLATLLFELPHLQGTTFYQPHQLFEFTATTASRLASVVLYLLFATALLIRRSRNRTPIVLLTGTWDRLILESSDTRSIGGLASGIARVTRLDVAWVRVFLIVLNLLTLGVIGGLYFLTVWLLRRAGRTQTEHIAPTPETISDDFDEGSIFTRIASGLFLFLAIIRLFTELHWFFFNESIIRGFVLGALGVIFTRRRSDPWLILSAILLFLGVYDLCAAIFHVQPSVAGWWEVSYLIATLSIVYYAVVSLRSEAARVAFGLAGASVIAMLLVATQMTSEPFLLALSQFYDFFYPLIFAGLGLWVAMEG